MAQRVRDILLRIRGDASDAESDLHDLARELKQFDGTVAEAKVDVDTTPAQRSLTAAKNSVREFGRLSEQAKLDLQTRAAEVKLDQLRRNLENLQRKPTTPKVDIAIGSTVAKIERIEHQLDRLDRRRVDVNVDVDRRGRAGGLIGGIGGALATGVGAAVSGIGTATEAVGSFMSAASRGMPIVGGLAQIFIELGASAGALGPIFLILVPLIGIAMVSAVTLLAGAVVALGASLLTAAAGVGVLGVALAAAFGPVVLVGLAAMARLAKVLDAVKQSQTGAADAAGKVRDANRAQADAQRSAVDAAGRVKTTAVEAYKAWAQAAEEVRDAIRGVAQAELNRDQAKLNVKVAEQNLKDLRDQAGDTAHSLDELFNKFTDVTVDTSGLDAALEKAGVGQGAGGPSKLDIEQAILDVRRARLLEKDAIDEVGDAHTRVEEARDRESQFLKNGIAAYEPYTAAVAASAAAQRALAKATEDSAKAREDQGKALKDLTPKERELAGVLGKLQTTLTRAFRPATDAIFGGVIDALSDLADFAKDTGVRRGLTDIGRAVGNMFRAIGRELRRKEFRDAFSDFAEGGADIIRTLTPVFRSLFRLITRLAQDALPWLLDLIGDVGRGIRHWAGDIDKGDLEGFVKRVRHSFNLWLGIVKELWGIVKEFFGDANDSGDELAGHIRDILRHFRLWLQENPDAVKKFFEDAAKFAGDLVDTLPGIIEDFRKMAHLAGQISGFFDKIKSVYEWIDKHKGPSLSDIKGPSGIDIIKGIFGRQHGGVIPGTGTGDIVPAMLEPGEFVIRRSVAQAIGIPRLNMLNSGMLPGMRAGGPVLAASGGKTVVEKIVIDVAGGGMPDPTMTAVKLARVLERRGGGPRQ